MKWYKQMCVHISSFTLVTLSKRNNRRLLWRTIRLSNIRSLGYNLQF